MPVALNNIQLEILKRRSLLITYLANKVTFDADNAFDEKGYAPTIYEVSRQDISAKHRDSD